MSVRSRGTNLDWLVEGDMRGDAGARVRDALGGDLAAAAGPLREGERVVEIATDQIDPSPYQARRIFDDEALASLEASVRRDGLLQPVVVRPRPGGRFELIVGERRWRVFRRIGTLAIPCVVREVDDLRAHLLGQVENDEREAVSAWEQALGYVELKAHLARAWGREPELEEIAELRGVVKGTVSKYLSVGEAFPSAFLARAGIAERDAATLSLRTLYQAAMRPAPQRAGLLKDVLRKRRVRQGGSEDLAGPELAGGPPSRQAASPETLALAFGDVPASVAAEEAGAQGRGAESAPEQAAAGPSRVDAAPSSGDAGSALAVPLAGWERFHRERAIRVETERPAVELRPAQARAALSRMIDPVAALAAAACGGEAPAPTHTTGSGGTLVYLPASPSPAVQAALDALLEVAGLNSQ